MQLSSETYMLYGVFFVLVLLGLLFTLVKRLGSSKNFPTPNESREKEKNEWTTPLQADGVSGKGFLLKAVASVTLDPNWNIILLTKVLGAREQRERLPHISSPRCGAGYETHWWE